ncbi:DUF6415 family natural product biosynthesis protein [Streptomyces sp. NPDC002573]|uniref:DUF6415 family natural product biosynthesis protein n=1 Tax=Streptomyces sp. NPDC002573 TaxID=3364651 RepID=UPI0036921D0B
MPPETVSAASPEPALRPPDIATMRETISRLLPPDVEPLDEAEVERLIGLLRGHLALMIEEVHQAAISQPKDDIPRYVALACLDEARGRLERTATGLGRYEAIRHARRLARSLNALCDHYEALTGAR